MKRKTYNNFMKAAKLIQKKGYTEKESYELAHRVFENVEANNYAQSAEMFIERILPYEEYKEIYC